MGKELTEKQGECLRFIIDFTIGHLYQPSWREIAFGLGLDSTNEVTGFIDALIKKGYLAKHEDRRTQRSLEIQKAALDWYRESTSDFIIKDMIRKIQSIQFVAKKSGDAFSSQ